jgi:hypothetical protein
MIDRYIERQSINSGIACMLIYEYKLDSTRVQYAAIDEAMRIVQFVRNKYPRHWMDKRGIWKNEYHNGISTCLGLKIQVQYVYNGMSA